MALQGTKCLLLKWQGLFAKHQQIYQTSQPPIYWSFSRELPFSIQDIREYDQLSQWHNLDQTVECSEVDIRPHSRCRRGESPSKQLAASTRTAKKFLQVNYPKHHLVIIHYTTHIGVSQIFSTNQLYSTKSMHNYNNLYTCTIPCLWNSILFTHTHTPSFQDIHHQV